VIRLLELRPHPEGGHFRETFRDNSASAPQGRAASTAIYYLLARGERSRWHRVDSAEVWHFYIGAPLELQMVAGAGHDVTRVTLGTELAAGAVPQAVVPPRVWQAAQSSGEWTLVGCTVAPGFEFAHFELAPQGWQPEQ
jgi:predicted cupin superfamily sugar epimerase